ncbi:MAG TPA: hypothetical protein VK633_06595 [Verrucomicrobiae bacterium]|nr:hypothetical protein [Verrucomicrobiae bacterium]
MDSVLSIPGGRFLHQHAMDIPRCGYYFIAAMKARVRELLRREPFRPFLIRMADGREYRIEHPDFVLAAASDVPQITIEERDGRQHYLSALLITSIEHVPGGISAEAA